MTPSSIIPRAPRIPSDLAVLDSLCPIQHTFKHWGRLDELMARSAAMVARDPIANADTVRPARRAK